MDKSARGIREGVDIEIAKSENQSDQEGKHREDAEADDRGQDEEESDAALAFKEFARLFLLPLRFRPKPYLR